MVVLANDKNKRILELNTFLFVTMFEVDNDWAHDVLMIKDFE